ncbi:uncharacterized protein [Halyomorpha halys]|uniref:uncharacterized protein n=1 Tax=Halyomorpha halys TaxID=286706 RepID=UPI000D0C74A8|nr:uncharacterized protein LOC112210314 [Halyomorpha halys]
MHDYKSSTYIYARIKEYVKELINIIDMLNYEAIDSSFLKRNVLECLFREINKLYSQFDSNRHRIKYVNRSIISNILKQVSKISERCKNDKLKVLYIRHCMIPPVFNQVIYLYNLCESKPFDFEIRFIEQLVIPKCIKIFTILYRNFGEFSFDTTALKADRLLVMKDCDYHGHLSFSSSLQFYFFVPHIRKKPKDYIDPVCGPEEKRLIFGGNFFASCLDGFHILHFLNTFQLEKSEIITLHYVKSVALYTALIKIPIAFIHFFFTETVDNFLRALLVYFQYYLQMWEVAKKRAELRKIKLPHTNSEYYESIWQNNLNDLRYFIARNYTIIILGIKDLVNFHHMNSPKGINTTTDYLLYELLYDFSTKIVMLVLNIEDIPEKNTIIQNEVNRLFRDTYGGNDKYFINIEEQERRILEGKFRNPREWRCSTPCLTEIKRPGRDGRIYHIGTTVIKTRNLRLRILQTALLISDENLKKANMQIGILGKPKKNYPPLLTCYQISRSEEKNKMAKKKQKEKDKKKKNPINPYVMGEGTSNNDSGKTESIEENKNSIFSDTKKSIETKENKSSFVEEPESEVKSSTEIDEMEEHEEHTEGDKNKTRDLVAIELFTLLLSMKTERRRQKKQRRFVKKMKRRYEAENIVGGDGTFLVLKEQPTQPYCLSYKLLTRSKTFNRDEALALWMKYLPLNKRFFYRIDPYSSIVDDYFDG